MRRSLAGNTVVHAIVRKSAVFAAALGISAAGSGSGHGSDPLQMLVATGIVDAGDRSRVDAGGAVFAVMPAEGRDLAVFGVIRTAATGERLAAWAQAIDRLYRGPYMPAVGRFSDPPHVNDVAGLALEEEDLNDLRKCRPGDCAVKLSAQEVLTMRAAGLAAGTAWQPAMQSAFRQVIVARARTYLDGGMAAIPPYHDRKKPVSPAAEFDAIAGRVGVAPLYGSQVLEYLKSYPDAGAGVESFLYWSKETLGAGKPIVSITHVAVFRTVPSAPTSAVVAARQVFASHYLTGSLSLTLITEAGDGTPAYLVYLRRSRTDAFEGVFGGFVRHVVEGRIRSHAPAALDALRRKLEGSDPPDAGISG